MDHQQVGQRAAARAAAHLRRVDLNAQAAPRNLVERDGRVEQVGVRDRRGDRPVARDLRVGRGAAARGGALAAGARRAPRLCRANVQSRCGRGRPRQRGGPLQAAGPRRRARAGIGDQLAQRRGQRRVVAAAGPGVAAPPAASRSAGTSVATTGAPQAIASTTGSPNPSKCDG